MHVDIIWVFSLSLALIWHSFQNRSDNWRCKPSSIVIFILWFVNVCMKRFYIPCKAMTKIKPSNIVYVVITVFYFNAIQNSCSWVNFGSSSLTPTSFSVWILLIVIAKADLTGNWRLFLSNCSSWCFVSILGCARPLQHCLLRRSYNREACWWIYYGWIWSHCRKIALARRFAEAWVRWLSIGRVDVERAQQDSACSLIPLEIRWTL